MTESGATTQSEAMDMFAQGGDDLAPAIARYLVTRKSIDELEAKMGELKSDKENLEKTLITLMQSRGLESMKTGEGVGISIVNKKNFSVGDEHKETLVDYCLENGLKNALSMHFQRLGSMCREWEKEGKLPEWVKSFEYKTLSVRGR